MELVDDEDRAVPSVEEHHGFLRAFAARGTRRQPKKDAPPTQPFCLAIKGRVFSPAEVSRLLTITGHGWLDGRPGHALVGHLVPQAEHRTNLDPTQTRIERHRPEAGVAPHGPVDLGVYGLQKSLADPLLLVFC